MFLVDGVDGGADEFNVVNIFALGADEFQVSAIVPVAVDRDGIDEDETFALGDLVEFRVLFHLARVASAAVQHDDQWQRAFGSCRHEDTVVTVAAIDGDCFFGA